MRLKKPHWTTDDQSREGGEDRMGKRVGNKNKNGNERMNKSHGHVKIGPLKRRKRKEKTGLTE